MLLLHLTAELLDLGYSFLGDFKAAFAKNGLGRIGVKLALWVKTKPEEGLYWGSDVEFLSKNVTGLEEIILDEVVCEEVDFDNEHANNELDDEHALVADGVLSSLLLWASSSRTHRVFIFYLVCTSPCHVFELVVVGVKFFIALILHHVHILLALSRQLTDVIIVELKEDLKKALFCLVHDMHNRDQHQHRNEYAPNREIENDAVGLISFLGALAQLTNKVFCGFPHRWKGILEVVIKEVEHIILSVVELSQVQICKSKERTRYLKQAFCQWEIQGFNVCCRILLLEVHLDNFRVKKRLMLCTHSQLLEVDLWLQLINSVKAVFHIGLGEVECSLIETDPTFGIENKRSCVEWASLHLTDKLETILDGVEVGCNRGEICTNNWVLDDGKSDEDKEHYISCVLKVLDWSRNGTVIELRLECFTRFERTLEAVLFILFHVLVTHILRIHVRLFRVFD